MRSVLAVLAVLLFGTASLWAGTDGFRAFTAESARRLAVREHPRALPDVLLQDAGGRDFRLRDYRGQRVLVEFIYTRCTTLCTVLGSSFQRVYRTAPERDVKLVSISFDPADTLTDLRDYARRYGADGRRWRVARVADPERLKALLRAAGVVVIPDGYGGFQHNAAIQMIDRRGRLARIFDENAVGPVLAALQR